MGVLRSATIVLSVALVLGASPASAQYASNPNGYTIQAPGSAARCSTIRVVVTPSSGGALWDAISWTGLTLEQGHTDNKAITGPASSWGLNTWHNGALWFCGSCPRGPAVLDFTVSGKPGTDATVTVGYGWDNVYRLDYGTSSTIRIAPSGATNVSVLAAATRIPADGTSTTAVTATCHDPNCTALAYVAVTFSTSKGKLRNGSLEESSVTVTADAKGRASVTLVADTIPGVAAITASISGGSGSTTVDMRGPSLTLTALPAEVPADGQTTSLLTATLVTAAGEGVGDATVTFNTDKGGLIVTAPDIGVPSVTANTNSSGTAMATLIPYTQKPVPTSGIVPVVPGDTVHVTASYTYAGGTITAQADVAAVGYSLTAKVEHSTCRDVSLYNNVIGTGYPTQDGAVVTWYGNTRVPVVLQLARGTTNQGVGSRSIQLRSPQRDALGLNKYFGYITFPETATTDSTGRVQIDLEVVNLWKVQFLTEIDLVAEFTDDQSGQHVSVTLPVTVVNNLQRVVSLYIANTPAGPIYDADTMGQVEAGLAPVIYRRLITETPGVANDELAGDTYAFLPAALRAQFVQSQSQYYQYRVLKLLNDLHHGTLRSEGALGSSLQCLLNGLDYAPLFVQGNRHLAACIYPGGTSYADVSARILDPWIEQNAVAYGYEDWTRTLAHPDLQRDGSGVVVQTKQFDDGPWGGPSSPSAHYPANGRMYYLQGEELPPPAETSAARATITAECPVLLTVTDGQGRRSGFAPSPAAGPLVDEIPGVRRSLLKKADGTLEWLFDLPAGEFTVTVRAHGSGTVTLAVADAVLGKVSTYAAVPVEAGQQATFVVSTGGLPAPALSFPGGASSAVVQVAAATPGVYPASSLVMGGGQAVVTGVDIAQGASITFGGVAAANVSWVNGTTKVTVPRNAAGVQDVVVTNPGQTAVTLAHAFTYEYVKRYFAEGATSDFFTTRIALANPTDHAANATLHFQRSDGQTVDWPVAVGAMSRATVDVNTVPGMSTAEFATAIDADESLMADRTMRWSRAGAQAGYGAHAERGVLAPAPVWYLAEGATHSGFDLFYLIQNLNTTDVTVEVKYLRPAPAAPVIKQYVIGPQRRFNIWVNGEGPELAATDVSAVLTSTTGAPIIVERAQYLSNDGRLFNAGHESAGVTTPATQWFLAEGATGTYFDLFVLVANPTGTDAQVEARYLLPSGEVLTKRYTVGANSRFNIWLDNEEITDGSGQHPLADAAVSTTIASLNGVPLIVERAMWWPGSFATWAEAHNSPGSTEVGTKWGVAEGEATGDAAHQETFILIANTAVTAGRARVTLLFEDGTTAERTVALPASSRTNVWVNAEFPDALGRRFGAIVESVAEGGGPAAEIVVERAMYSNAGGVSWAAGTNALGTRLR